MGIAGRWGGGQGFEPVTQLLVLELNAVEVFFWRLGGLSSTAPAAAAAAFANWSHLTRSAFDVETAAVAFVFPEPPRTDCQSVPVKVSGGNSGL